MDKKHKIVKKMFNIINILVGRHMTEVFNLIYSNAVFGTTTLQLALWPFACFDFLV